MRDTEGSSDEEEAEKTRVKWKTLEHHGVIFFPAY